MRDVFERFQEHVPVKPNLAELPADLKIRKYACGETRVKGDHANSTGRRKIANGVEDCSGNMPYKKLIGV